MPKSDFEDDIINNSYQATIDKLDNLPRLPDTTNELIKKSAMTHPSVPLGSGINPKYRYDKLAFSGEGIIFTFITALLQDLYPEIDKESASALRTKLTSPSLFSALSVYYNLPKEMTISRHLQDKVCHSIKSTSEMFVAHLGGLYYAYEKEHLDASNGERLVGSTDGTQKKQSSQDKDKSKKKKLNTGIARPALKSRDTNIADELIQAESNEVNHIQASSQSYIQLIPFLKAVFLPLAQALHDPTEDENRRLKAMSEGSKAELHLLLGRDKMQMPIYTQDKILPEDGKGESGLNWRVRCTVIFPHQQIIIREEGIAPNSKDASNIAAYLALQKVREIKGNSGKRKRGESDT
ncbi:uncharacterized protein I206_107226 [Kwoniella pini CBS 10737]|uniref:RNase III domain-containing protein n=1 Tax=Kwoniella pini CBS 10737 TaxID=1296096 RepID=A0A1B9HYZ4_9TREE|nr:uncharacterized protein I206_05230 [Kwoniella pini CBS 10737]OCF48451.1 hypothetical protein I206_05230 [Kwoniella pini CBS 10737]